MQPAGENNHSDRKGARVNSTEGTIVSETCERI